LKKIPEAEANLPCQELPAKDKGEENPPSYFL
jgi:hypothetical protein